ncbi:MAG: M20 family metallopeptidase [Anaerolineae bacterium]
MMISILPAIHEAAHQRLPAMLDDLRALVEHESPTDNKGLVDRAQALLAERLAQAGASVERLPQEQVGDHLRAVWAGTGQRQPVLLLGHMDTVWPAGELRRRPARVEDGYFYGPGAFDMKAGLVIVIHAMEVLRQFDLPLTRDVVLLVNSDEEWGSVSSRSIIEAEARRSDYVLVMEPALGPGMLTVGRKGVGRFWVRVQGRAAHAGREPEKGVSAIAELAQHILYLQSLNDLERGVTVTVGVVHGGTRPNVVPAEAVAEVDLRVPNRMEEERMASLIRQLTPYHPQAGVTVEGTVTRPAWEADSTCLALFHRARVVGEHLDMHLERGVSGGGSDGNFTAVMGIPTLDGLGPEGAGAHAVDERVAVESLPLRAALLAGLLLDLSINGH